jgi:hypothetical protein
MENGLKRLLKPLIISLGRRVEARSLSRPPIVIGACPRSGTTLLLSILDAHPDIHSIRKQTYAFTRWDREGRPTRLDRLYRQLLLHPPRGSCRRWCEKTPKNIQHFGRILSWFEEGARLIHIVRDGRDVVTSRHPRHRPDQYWVSVRRWVGDVRAGMAYAHSPLVHTVRYEDLIGDFEGRLRELMEFLEEPVAPEVLDWFHHTSVKRSRHWTDSVQRLHTRAVGRWDQPEHRERLEEFMADGEALALSRRLGYLDG